MTLLNRFDDVDAFFADWPAEDIRIGAPGSEGVIVRGIKDRVGVEQLAVDGVKTLALVPEDGPGVAGDEVRFSGDDVYRVVGVDPDYGVKTLFLERVA
ncbi:MAG: hypothetical protein LBL72_08440 [Candidatus Accumulibacter sp.]|jgi:hypothetical protein|nr:hypothetical protein [Accumulibacter sp.]